MSKTPYWMTKVKWVMKNDKNHVLFMAFQMPDDVLCDVMQSTADILKQKDLNAYNRFMHMIDISYNSAMKDNLPDTSAGTSCRHAGKTAPGDPAALIPFRKRG
jgi:hypothetical protein